MGHDEYRDIRQFRSVEKMRDRRGHLLFLSGNFICWVTLFRESSSGEPNRIIFRGGPYGRANTSPLNRERAITVRSPTMVPMRGCSWGGIWPCDGEGRISQARPLDLRGNRRQARGPDPWPDRLGVSRRSASIPGLEVVAAGTAWQGGINPQQWTATIYPAPRATSSSTPRRSSGPQGLSTPPGHVLPWSHWSRPHGPDPRVQQITRNLLQRALA